MTRESASVAGVFGAALLIVAGYASGWMPGGAPPFGVACMIIGCALMIACASALGAMRSGVPPAVALFVGGFLLVVIGGAFGAVLLIRSDPPWLVLGLPLRAAIEVYGVGIFPVVVLPLVFAATFRRRDR
ncbi:MAG: hypothetical protein ACREL5_11420 [Gemmatimonadales bacterium]